MTLKLTLLENSMDYVDRAIRDIDNGLMDNVFEFKYAVIHIFAAIELLMKEKLRREHWTLLFDKVDEASIKKLASGDFKSPGIDKIAERLQRIVGIDSTHLRLNELTELKKIRNRIQHFSIDIRSTLARETVAKGINLYISLSRACFGELDENYIRKIISAMNRFKEFVDLRLTEIAPAVAGSARPYHERFRICGFCGNDTVVIDQDNNFECLFCENTFDSEDVVSGLTEGPVNERCPKCGRKSIAFILYNNEEGADVCAFCDFIVKYPEGEDWEAIKQATYFDTDDEEDEE